MASNASLEFSVKVFSRSLLSFRTTMASIYDYRLSKFILKFTKVT